MTINSRRNTLLKLIIILINVVGLPLCQGLVLPRGQPKVTKWTSRLNHTPIESILFGNVKTQGDINDTRNNIINNTFQRAGFIGLAPIKLAWTTFTAAVGLLIREINSLSFHQKIFCAGTFVLGFALGRMRPFWKRYTDMNDIPSSMFGQEMRGRAVSVSDGDTIRFLHQPTPLHPSELQSKKDGKKEKVSEVALPIRLCTIDTPETAKFGKSGQPFGNEAKEHLKSLLEDKVVRIRLLQKDQYSRGVAEVFTRASLPFFWRRKYMDAEMLREGLAEVYTGGGAVYGPLGKDAYLAMEDKARKAKKGIWSLKNRESAAEYKKRTKE